MQLILFKMKYIIISIKYLLVMTILTGVVYPVFVFGIAKVFFPQKSGGSLIEVNGNIVGSELIAQKFDSSIYFQPRPSAVDFSPVPSGGSNLGPTSLKLKTVSDSLKKSYINNNHLNENANVPVDAIFSSASGLDPHISPENALLQVDRICSARGFDSIRKSKLLDLINSLTENPQFEVLGEQRLNVLKLNIELDKL